MADHDPLIYGPDGVLRQTVNFSTSLTNRFLDGTIPDDAVDVQVSINGSGWSSDPSLVQWGDGAWVVPNPTSEPDGLLLLSGVNTIRLRVVLPSGSTTVEATASITLVSSADLGVIASVPTNISVEQKNNQVVINAETSSNTGFRGMNFYASLSAGGGASGYTRINVNLVTEGSVTQESTQFASLDVDAEILVDGDGNPVADPMFFRMLGQQENSATTSLQVDFNEAIEIPETARDIRITSTLYSVRDVTLYSFAHNRAGTSNSTPATVQVGAFASLSNATVLYYVVTAVFYDETQNLEFESSYSEEVVGRPTTVTTALGAFPTTSRQSIVQQFITAIFRSNPQVKVETGSILRDTVIDPFSSESGRLRFILDFFHRARTPSLLLQIDDPNGSGVSIPVSQSPYKQGLQAAFYLSSAQDVQNVIDSCFDAFASNYGKQRLAGIASQGEVTFYTSRRPSSSVVIPLGTIVSGGGLQFSTTRAAAIPFERLASFYNPVSGRYQINVPIRALTAGSAGNLGTGQVNGIVSALTGSMSVINTGLIKGGEDQESNLDLTIRVQNSLASVDSGTARGYLQTAADVAGVIKASVISAGDDLMQRDLDSTGIHRGGKVDVWVQGTNPATVTDTFAFSFEIAQDIQFEIIGSPTDLTFRALDATLSAENPIVEMLEDAAEGYALRNVTTGDVFDLTDVVISSYDTIQLSTAVVQPSVNLSDVVLGSYRRRAGNVFVLPRQPVSAVTSVTGTISGELPSDAFLLIHPDSPLVDGRSTRAQDYLQINSYIDADGNQVPSGDSVTVTGEVHVLIGQYEEFLDTLGANFLTLEVYNSDRTILYKGPNDPSGDPDYTVNLGSQIVPISITRTETGDIPSGATVSVDYTHDENFTVTYTTSLIVSLTQDAINISKHATADVLAKEAIPILLDVQATVVLIRGREQSTVDTALRTNMTNFFTNLRLGDPVRQSDLVNVIEKTEGVSYVVVPLSKMVPASGSSIVREEVSTDSGAESTLVTSLSTVAASVYLLNNELQFATTDGAGPDGSFKGVTQDDIALTLLEASTSLSALGVTSGRVYVIGSEGRSIVGVSDDATLILQGYVTSSAIEARRKELTANHLLVSLAVGTSPTSYAYAATYVVGTDSGAKDIDPGSVQYVSAGSILFTYDEDR